MEEVYVKHIEDAYPPDILEAAREGFLYDAWYGHDVLIVATKDIDLDEEIVGAILDDGDTELEYEGIILIVKGRR